MVIVMERNVEEERAHSKPAACPAFPLRQRELPAAARKSELPLSRFPRGKAGAGGFPPRGWHAVCQQKALAHIDAAAPPARGVSPAEFAQLFGDRPFALPILRKAGPAPGQGFANAGQKPPALDRQPALPKRTQMRAKGLPERPMRAMPVLERVN